MFAGLKATGLISDVIPSTKNTLNILDPIIFPTAILALDFLTAAIDVASSGSDVQIANIVSPISFSLHPRIVASVTAFSTTIFPPRASHVIHHNTKSTDFG